MHFLHFLIFRIVSNFFQIVSNFPSFKFDPIVSSNSFDRIQYAILHAVPPQSAPKVLSEAKNLTNAAGFVDVNKDTLQHVSFPNVFALGDCTSTPNSKTMAAIGNKFNFHFFISIFAWSISCNIFLFNNFPHFVSI